MTSSLAGSKVSLRTRPRTKGDKASAKARSAKGKPVDIAGLIDAAFSRRVTAKDGGKSVRITVLAGIYRQLWACEMAGDARAMAVRLKYEAFVREQQPAKKREIIVKGGLPQLPPYRPLDENER